MNFLKLDCLFSKKKNKYYVITKHNYKKCQSLWVASRERYGRAFINNIGEAIKYNKKEQFIKKALSVLNSDLKRQEQSLKDMLEEYNNSNYQYLFEDSISELEYDIAATKRHIKKYENM